MKNIPLSPIWKSGEDVVFQDSDTSSKIDTKRWAACTCPECGAYVGEQYIPKFIKAKPYNQNKCNFCSNCGQAIDWSKV